MNKIIIIGGNGSGKTTFARELSRMLDIPLIFIDKIYWTDNWVRADEEAANAVLGSEMMNSCWIIDGNHIKTLNKRLNVCDTVFYFDFNTINCLFGCIFRTLKHYGLQRDDVGGKNNIEKFDWSKMAFFKSVIYFNRNNREKILSLIANSENTNVVIFKNRKQVKAYLRQMNEKINH